MDKWIIRENHIGLSHGENTFYIPPASDIYSSIFEGKQLEGNLYTVNTISEDLPHIHFSRIGALISLQFDFDQNKKNIYCSAFVKKGKEKYDVTISVKDHIDHVVFKDTWFYIGENLEQICDYFSECDITDISCIAFPSYLKALKKSNEYRSIKIDFNIKENREYFCSIGETHIPEIQNASLYPYQVKGFLWLKFITDQKCGCILGDEMGLGKTLQVITLLLSRKSFVQSPSLVVAPVSLLENWRRELQRFAPSLRVLVNHGPLRIGYYKKLLEYDVIIVSYSAIGTDFSMLCSVNWDLLIADEAQYIKNPYASRTKSIKSLKRISTIAISGTPFENHMSDLWSIIDFVLPSFLGSFPSFQKEFPDTIEGADKIEPILTPIMLRRLVDDVSLDLPERVIIPVPMIMTEKETENYENERQEILKTFNMKNIKFAELSSLRMYCTHPVLHYEKFKGDPVSCCTKYSRLCDILYEIKSKNDKVILFTSFIRMCDLLRDDIPNRIGIPVFVINGKVPASERQKIIDSYSNISGTALLVLNPRAAATGLNITAANHVIHYNLEWNPSLEDQASARVYRKGQTKKVFIHRMYYVGTVEEFVNDKIIAKREMTKTAVVGNIGDMDSRERYLEALVYSPVDRGE